MQVRTSEILYKPVRTLEKGEVLPGTGKLLFSLVEARVRVLELDRSATASGYGILWEKVRRVDDDGVWIDTAKDVGLIREWLSPYSVVSITDGTQFREVVSESREQVGYMVDAYVDGESGDVTHLELMLGDRTSHRGRVPIEHVLKYGLGQVTVSETAAKYLLGLRSEEGGGKPKGEGERRHQPIESGETKILPSGFLEGWQAAWGEWVELR